MSQPLQTLSCVVHQVHQAAVEGQDTHLCAELSKEVFVLLCKGLCLIPKIKGLQDVGCEVDIGGGHVLDGDWGTDGGRHPAAPHAANT